MNAFLNPQNIEPSLTGITDVATHSIRLFQENEPPKILLTFPYLKVILVLLSLMVFRSLNWGIAFLLCINLLEILMTQKLVD